MLTRFGPGWSSLGRLRQEMDHLFENISDGLSPWVGLASAGVFPATNVWEDERNVYVEAELPGLKMEDLEILACGNELTIRGERKNGCKGEATYHRRERGVGSFSRVLRLPVPVDAEKIEAALKAGVLTITLPKAEAARPRRIEVKSA